MLNNKTVLGLSNMMLAAEQPQDAQAGLASLSNTERFKLANPTGSAYDTRGKLLNNVSASPGSAAEFSMMETRADLGQRMTDSSNLSRLDRVGLATGDLSGAQNYRSSLNNSSGVDYRRYGLADAEGRAPATAPGLGLSSATGYNSERQNSTIALASDLSKSLRDGAAKFSGGPQDPVTRTGSSFRGAMGLADGGSVDEAARMRAEMAKKYGLGTASLNPEPSAQPQPTVQPAQPQSPPTKRWGLTSIFSDRKKQIDAAAGYRKGGLVDVKDMRGGGKLTGPGTATSDSIPIVAPHAGYMLPAKTVEALGGAEAIREMLERLTGNEATGDNQAEESGEGVPVMGSNGEVMLTPAEVAALGGKEVLDALVRVTNGKEPGGVPVRDGAHPMAKKMAVGGFVDDETKDKIDYRPTAASDLQARSNASEAVRTVAQRAAGIDTGSGNAMSNARYGLNSIANNAGVRDAFNAAHDVQGDGINYGVTTGADGKKQTLISGGVATKPQYVDRQGQATNDYYRTDQFAQGLQTADRMAKLAAGMQAEREAGERTGLINRLATSGNRELVDGARTLAAMRPSSRLETEARMDSLGRARRVDDLVDQAASEADPDKRAAFVESALALQGKAINSGGRHGTGGLTIGQIRQNEEIEAARGMVSELSQEDIRTRTTPTTASGRENPLFDPQLVTAAKLANRRKLGDDPWFDNQHVQTQTFLGKPVGQLSDEQLQRLSRAAGAQGKEKLDAELLRRRFSGDEAMADHTLGDRTPKGYKVLDKSGRHVGYYN